MAQSLQHTRFTPPAAAQSRALYVITSGFKSNGYRDFLATLDKHVSVMQTFSLGFQPADNILETFLTRFTFVASDLLVIVRGGGNPLHPSFAPFYHFGAAQALQALRETGVTVITGLGHVDNVFTLDYAATFREITPTAAAIRTNRLLQQVHPR
jgi:exonuclease VII large subunit